jgi:hypothetical protein
MLARLRQRFWLCAVLVVLAGVTHPSSLSADEIPAGAVQPASATPDSAGDAPSGPAVRFTHAETRVGDRAVQRIGLQMSITTKIIQSGQVAHESAADLRRQQQRTIDVLEVAEGRAVRARATFDVSRRQAPDQDDPKKLTVLPIEGKSYLMARKDDNLAVTDLEGAIPPLEEYTLVAESLESVGKPNPLVEVLAGRVFRVGQRVLVPRETAKLLLDFGAPDLARVHRFELTLDRLTPLADGSEPAAVFRVAIEVRPEDADDYTMHLSGEMAVEPATCRVASIDLAGPVQVSTIERTPLGIYQYTMGGELRVAIRSQFVNAPAR